MECTLWQNGTFTIYSCVNDLGWTSPLDVPVFLLRAYWPALLTFISNPANIPFPMNTLIALPIIQSWLHRWDHVDLSDPVQYSAQYTCAWLQVIPWLIIASVVGYLLTLGPLFQTLAWLFSLFALIATAMFFFAAAFFIVLYYMMHTPGVMAQNIARQMGKRKYYRTLANGPPRTSVMV